MDKRRPLAADVDGLLARWRQLAGENWREMFQERLETCDQVFAGSSNPLEVWEAILLCRALGETPPDWVLDYLAASAAGVLKLRDKSFGGEAIKPSQIGRALGMV